ncbi:MAG TPA: class I SAM-dependent methyltransferase [Steroidobacteraceae bacterium]|nr:class I SAM-dependent methyltransferase [Steroidobacteraceae bacterium]
MGIGRRVRRMFGKHERTVSDAWRSAFVDLEEFTSEVKARVKSADSILEIGCGDGAVMERLAAAFPHARLTGIDICASPGRLFRGDSHRVRFLQASAAELLAREPSSYGLVMIADVIHHVPPRDRIPLLQSALGLAARGGTIVFKEWLREPSVICLANFLIERIITGDRVHYLRESELHSLASEVFGPHSIRAQFRIAPWSCNLALVIAPSAGTPSTTSRA